MLTKNNMFGGLTTPKLVLALFILALAFRAEHRLHFRNLYLDTEVQLTAAHNWLEGKGLMYEVWNPEDPCTLTEIPLGKMMPGYVWLVSVCYLLIGDWLWAAYALDVLAIWAVLIAMKLILRGLIREPSPVEGLFWLFLAISPAPFHYMASNDLLGWAFFCWMCWAFLRAIKHKKRSLLIATALLSLCAGMVRYAYVPLMILPVLFGALTYRVKVMEKKDWLLLSIIQTLAILSVILTKFFLTDSVNYLAEKEASWQFQHLLWTDPFPMKTFLYYGVPHLVGLSEIQSSLPYVVQVLSWLGSIGLVWMLWKFVSSSKDVSTHLFIEMGLGCALAVWMMLAYASLMEAAQDWNLIYFWTYVMETRYYAPAMLFILVGVGIMLKNGKPLQQNILKSSLGLLLAAYIVVFVYQHHQIYKKDASGLSFLQQDKENILKKVAEARKEHSKVYVLSKDGEYFPAIAGGIVVPRDSAQKLRYCEGVMIWYLAHNDGDQDWIPAFYSDGKQIQLKHGMIGIYPLTP
ncbi:MAG: hypothetical protein AAF388_05205 [Bacteroidota bacterium]